MKEIIKQTIQFKDLVNTIIDLKEVALINSKIESEYLFQILIILKSGIKYILYYQREYIWESDLNKIKKEWQLITFDI